MKDQPITIKILQFDPLRLELLNTVRGQGTNFLIVLPPVRVNLMDLGMLGELYDGAHIEADMPLFECYANFKEPVLVGRMVEHIVGAADKYKKMWEHLQKGMNAADPLLG